MSNVIDAKGRFRQIQERRRSLDAVKFAKGAQIFAEIHGRTQPVLEDFEDFLALLRCVEKVRKRKK